jgi:tetratricopeptide (TPR) repeat protein
MDNIQELVNKAQELKEGGDFHAALACYSDIFDLLIKESDEYARKQEGSIIDVGKLRTITTKLFEESRKYLKRDKTAAIISNNMGSLFARLGDVDNAKKMFEQAIDLTPDDKEYTDPKIGLIALGKKEYSGGE